MQRNCVRILWTVVAAAGFAFAQEPTKFDISTVKPNLSGTNNVNLNIQPGGRFIGTNIPLKLLMQEGYEVRDFQISGGPNWIGTDRWDIQAQAENVEGRLSLEQFRPMLKALIEDRFHLRVHRESKEMAVYELTIAKSGSKIQPNQGEIGPNISMRRGEMTGKKLPMALIAQQLAQQLGRPVVDKTGLTGEYDFKLTWTPEVQPGAFAANPSAEAAPPAGADGPTIFTAIQEQLGLKLESARGPVDTIVIDSVEKPSEN